MVSVLLNPVDGVGAAVEGRRWALPLVLLASSVSLSGAAFALRWDGTSTVLREMASAGELARASEREIAEAIQVKERIRLVAGVARGIFLMPLAVLAAAAALKLAAWLLGRSASYGACVSAAALALLPVAVYHLVFAAAALRQVAVTESQAATLVPASLAALRLEVAPKVLRALSAVDFFNLWSAVLLGLGFAAASGMSRPRALVLGLVLYAMYAAVFIVALPGLTGGGT
jgi:hypothetical protein